MRGGGWGGGAVRGGLKAEILLRGHFQNLDFFFFGGGGHFQTREYYLMGHFHKFYETNTKQ